MSNNSKNANQKNANVSAKSEKLENINFSKFSDKIKEIAESAKVINSRKNLEMYIFPDNLPKDRSASPCKNFRNARRAEIKKFVNNAIIAFHKKDSASLKAIINEFEKVYKEFYSLNDYSINSLTQSPKDENRGNIEIFLEIVKSIK